MSSLVLNMVGGSGGGSLNLTVVGGTTKPASPNDNTIWLNTSTTITDWCISNTPPGNPSNGDVYIRNRSATTNIVDIGGDNTVLLYVGTAWQYTSGEWVKLTGEIYFNSAWHKLDTLLYDGTIGSASGNFNETVGGYPWVRTGQSSEEAERFEWGYSGPAGSWYCSTKDMIDFTDVSAIKVTYTCTSGGGTYKFGIFLTQSVSGANDMVAYVSSSTSYTDKQTITIDTSSITGMYYYGMHYAKSQSSGGKKISTYSVELIS